MRLWKCGVALVVLALAAACGAGCDVMTRHVVGTAPYSDPAPIKVLVIHDSNKGKGFKDEHIVDAGAGLDVRFSGNWMTHPAYADYDYVVIARAEQPLAVNLVGFPALLSRLAFGHSLLYGILATLIALLAGLGIGLIFQSRGAH